MKLYFSPGACSLAPHIVIRELGHQVQLEKVDLRTKAFSGGDLRTINPKGYVPVLETEDGQVLTEGPAIMQYLADQRETGVVPKAGTPERYRQIEWLNYVSTEIHKTFALLFGAAGLVQDPNAQEQLKSNAKENLAKKFEFLNEQLKDKNFLMGSVFTAADAYLFTTLRWSGHFGIDLKMWPNLSEYFIRVGARPKVIEAMEAEGLRHSGSPKRN